MIRYADETPWLPEEVTFIAEGFRIPNKFAQANLRDWGESDEDYTADLCRTYVTWFDTGTDGMLFSGPTGFGKTHYACAVINELIRVWSGELAISAFYFNLNADLPRLLEDKQFRRDAAYNSTLTKLLHSDILIVDDLLHVSNQEWAKAVLYRIYEARYASGLRTITTLNAKIEEGDEGLDWSPISDVYNDAFMRRVVEGAGNNIVRL